MPKIPYKTPGMLDSLAGETIPESSPRGGSGWSNRPKGRTTRRDVTTGSQAQTRAQKNVRPEEVSERVWGMAEHWLDLGEAKFGRRPPVNKQEFSKRLDARIASDPVLQHWLRGKPSAWQERYPGRWDSGIDFVNDVMARMIEMFFEGLTADQENNSLLQMVFLTDEWDEWRYHAITSVQLSWLKENGSWSSSKLPSAVFDPATIGVPRDDEPCSDPVFEGLTWGEVRAQAKDDESLMTPRMDDRDYVEPERADKAPGVLATWKRAIVANRDNTTQETTHAGS